MWTQKLVVLNVGGGRPWCIDGVRHQVNKATIIRAVEAEEVLRAKTLIILGKCTQRWSSLLSKTIFLLLKTNENRYKDYNKNVGMNVWLLSCKWRYIYKTKESSNMAWEVTHLLPKARNTLSSHLCFQISSLCKGREGFLSQSHHGRNF